LFWGYLASGLLLIVWGKLGGERPEFASETEGE
jgi:hypothetical protein